MCFPQQYVTLSIAAPTFGSTRSCDFYDTFVFVDAFPTLHSLYVQWQPIQNFEDDVAPFRAIICAAICDATVVFLCAQRLDAKHFVFQLW